jgi:hypothetical protein
MSRMDVRMFLRQYWLIRKRKRDVALKLLWHYTDHTEAVMCHMLAIPADVLLVLYSTGRHVICHVPLNIMTDR